MRIHEYTRIHECPPVGRTARAARRYLWYSHPASRGVRGSALRRAAGAGGFTLVETLVAIAVLVLLATVISSGLASFRESAALDQAVDETLEFLREARSKTLASEGASSYGVHFAPAAVTMFQGWVYSPSNPTNTVVQLPALVEISSITLSTTTASVVFERLTGESPAAGTVTFRTTRSAKTRQIQVLPSGVAVALSAAAAGTMKITSGSYVGDGAASRAIGGIGFKPDAVIIKGDTGQVAVMRINTMAGDSTKPLAGASALTVNLITSLDANGFTVGSASAVNSSGVTYHWIAFQAAAGALGTGSYMGNGGASQSISGLGFSPAYAIVMSASSHWAVQRSSTMTSSFRFDPDGGAANRITALDANGFTVGSGAEVNASGVIYHFVAWDAVMGKINVGAYVGNGTDNRNITGVGFQPEYAIARKDGTGQENVHKSSSTGINTDISMDFDASHNDSNEIQTLLVDGFQVGTDGDVNSSGVTYHWIAFGQ